jgi:hypothetical protein
MKILNKAFFVAALLMAKAFSADGGSITQLQMITGNDGKKYFRIAHSVAVQIGSNISSSQDYIQSDEDPTYAALVWASLDRALHDPTIRVNIDGFSTTNSIDGTAWVCKLTRWSLTR